MDPIIEIEIEDIQGDAQSYTRSKGLEDPVTENSTKCSLISIIVNEPSNWKDVVSMMEEANIHFIRTRTIQNGIKIFTEEPRDYNRLKSMLPEGNK